MDLGKPCIKCLVRELGERELLQSLEAYRYSVPPEEQAEEREYHRRLELCKACDWLRQGICGKCGCFVEARAYRSGAVCPHELPRW